MKTILIASPEPSYHLEVLVKQLGYSADVVKDGIAALAYLRDHNPDLIIADAKLANISGCSLACRSKKVARLRQVPVCLMVETYDADARAEALISPIDSIILKPYTASFVKETLRQHLRESFIPLYTAPQGSTPAAAF